MSDQYSAFLFVVSDLTEEDIEEQLMHRATELSFDRDGYEKLINDIYKALDDINHLKTINDRDNGISLFMG